MKIRRIKNFLVYLSIILKIKIMLKIMLEKVGAVIGMVVLVTVLLAWPVQLLWNYSLVGAVDGVNPITFWQAMGINFLFSMLFKSSSNK